MASLSFKNDKVIIKDEKYVEQLIKTIIDDGVDKLQVVSDFDKTLTRCYDNDGVCHSCFIALDNYGGLPGIYMEKASQLMKHYYPIEVDHNLTIEEKTPHMVEWWDKAHQLLIEHKVLREKIPDAVKKSRIFFRDGCNWLFKELHEKNVPLLVFSAGIGNVIEETFKIRAHLYDNIKIVSNFMRFDEQGIVNGFVGELMHVFNKNENAIHNSDYFKLLSHRSNVVLMGDSLGDLKMAEGAKAENILKIGFLNSNIESLLEIYKNSFDIVLINDMTMDVPNAIMKLICESKGKREREDEERKESEEKKEKIK